MNKSLQEKWATNKVKCILCPIIVCTIKGHLIAFMKMDLLMRRTENGRHLSCVTGKHALRSLSLSYLKKDWRAGPANLSLDMTPTTKLYAAAFRFYFYSQCHTKSRIGGLLRRV